MTSDARTPFVPTTSSWESMADEVAPLGAEQPRRGLATGAMRGKVVRDPLNPKAAPVWLSAPEAPRAISYRMPSHHEFLNDALQGEEKFCATNGRHFGVSRPAPEYDAVFATLKARMQKVLDCEKFVELSGANAGDVLFVDIETTGLSATRPLFLIGALRMDCDPCCLELFLARGRAEEKAALAAFHLLAAGKRLVTFNGKRFDWPYIVGRSQTHGLDFETPCGHFDLLHHARRTWKHSLPNCKLQTLELYLCGRTRLDDVPGYQIPWVYEEFVRLHSANGGGGHLMAGVLHHNALDILTMAELVCLAGEIN